MSDEYSSITEVTRPRGVPAKVLSDWFYRGKLDESRCPMVGGRRLIPKSYIPTIEKMLKDAGLMKEPSAA